MNSSRDRSQRFTGRAADYVRGRPGYSDELFDRLITLAGLETGSVVADLGSGTGISSAPLLARGLKAIAVEPNAEMRASAEERFGADPSFVSVDGRAEATGLAPASVDLVLACQAFHWFDVAATRVEALRILRPPASAALVWNARRADGSALARDYEDLLLEFGTDYRDVGHRGISEEKLRRFFGGRFELHRFASSQTLDRSGLRARLLSSSYVPERGAARHEEMLEELDRLFARHAAGGAVTLDYDVDLFFGRLAR